MENLSFDQCWLLIGVLCCAIELSYNWPAIKDLSEADDPVAGNAITVLAIFLAIILWPIFVYRLALYIKDRFR